MNNNFSEILRFRRQQLGQLIDFPAILWSGISSPRNFPANKYPYRANSHFLYFAGIPLENAAIILERGNLQLFMDDPHPSNNLWHGPAPNREEIAAKIGADEAKPMTELVQQLTTINDLENIATIPVQDAATWTQQTQILNRFILPQQPLTARDLELAKAIISLRLCHDDMALIELKKAINVSITAHKKGMEVTRTASLEAEIRAAMEAVIISENMTTAYSSIVTVHGEILHNQHYHHPIKSGDLLLADVGAETANGWASDITRTWPVSGKFSPTQKDIYDIVLTAHDACIANIFSGVEYAEIHLLAAKIIAEGLVNLGILRGKPEDLVKMNVHALFFPHGIGHLLGLDVHDMEDLGDLAGYDLGRERSSRFGLSYLRLNRPLLPGMLVTIEPGFYQVPAILNDPKIRNQYQYLVNWERLAQFADVRGIRIEDDVLVTTSGREVLTAALPTRTSAIEDLVS